MSKKKQRLIDWQEEQKPAEEKPLTREELIKKLLKVRNKRPLIRSSHGGGT